MMHLPPQARSPTLLSQPHLKALGKVINCLLPLQSIGTSQPVKQKGVPFVGLKTFLQSARTITFPFVTSVDDGLQISGFAVNVLQNTRQLDKTRIFLSIIFPRYVVLTP